VSRQAHVVDANGQPICPEAAKRDAMTDEEFWWHVFPSDGPDTDEEYEAHIASLTPCLVCGEDGPCGYDDQGNALVHVVPGDDEGGG
jgi:hypothetical protein